MSVATCLNKIAIVAKWFKGGAEGFKIQNIKTLFRTKNFLSKNSKFMLLIFFNKSIRLWCGNMVLSKWRSMLGAEKIPVLNSINAWSHNGFWPVVINLIISLHNYYNNNNNENGSPLVRNWRPFPTQMDKKRAPRVHSSPKKKKQKLPQSCSKGRIFFRIRQGLYRTMGSLK